MSNQRVMNLAKQLGADQYVDWLISKFGPALSEILLDVMMKRSQPTLKSLIAETDAAGSGFDVTLMLVSLLEKFAPTLEQKLQDYLNSKTDAASKLMGMLLQQAGPGLVSMLIAFLKSQEGQVAMADAMKDANLTGAQAGPHDDEKWGKPMEAAGAFDFSGLLSQLLQQFLPSIIAVIMKLFQTPQGQQALATAMGWQDGPPIARGLRSTAGPAKRAKVGNKTASAKKPKK